jgi:glycosylphosphatidylinositol deacylase
MGHSMGGIVVQAVLDHHNPTANYTVSRHVSAVFTMSTPHRLPPARFDQRIERVYSMATRGRETGVPVLSICGGVADGMIPSESCSLGEDGGNSNVKTVFTSGMEGAWTGVGHREMVWCHQVRWRIARASLEIGTSSDPMEVLNRWFRDGSGRELSTSPGSTLELQDGTFNVLPEDVHLTLKNPSGSEIPMYLLPVPSTSKQFILYLSQGSIGALSPHNHIPLQAIVYRCWDTTACEEMQADTLKLIPNPIDGKPFPVPMDPQKKIGGVDESEGVVLFEGEVDGTQGGYVGVKLRHADGRGWVLGGFTGEHERKPVTMLDLLFGGTVLKGMQHPSLKVSYELPWLLQHVFVVYRLKSTESTCTDSLLYPLIEHTSQLFETHYFPLRSTRKILLHTHSDGPYVRSLEPKRGLTFSIYSDACQFDELRLSIDWAASLGRIPPRYAMTMLSWAIGVVSLILFGAWHGDGSIAPVQSSLSEFCGRPLRMVILVFGLIALIPHVPQWAYLGHGGEAFLAPLAPMMALIASGMVIASWWVLDALVWGLSKIFGRRSVVYVSSNSRSSILSMAAIFLLVFLFVPWQVAYLCCWIIHLYTCATTRVQSTAAPSSSPEAVPLVTISSSTTSRLDEGAHTNPGNRPAASHYAHTAYNYNTHILLWMTWLLPLAAPVLVVWARTLITAGLTTPFDGDHFFLNVAPFAVLVEFASSGRAMNRHRLGRWLHIRWGFAVLAVVAFFVGSRWTYVVFDVARLVAAALLVIIWVGRTT